MLYQLHWQFKDGSMEMRAQKFIKTQKEMKKWESEVSANHPLPDNAQWLVCNEKSKHFVWAKAEPGQEEYSGEYMPGLDVEVCT